MRRTYVRVVGEGVELLFQDEHLSTVFRYLTEGPENCGAFLGTTDALDRDVLEFGDQQKFSGMLESKGFWSPERSYPIATDRLNDHLRIRLEKREDYCLVIINDGAMLR